MWLSHEVRKDDENIIQGYMKRDNGVVTDVYFYEEWLEIEDSGYYNLHMTTWLKRDWEPTRS